MINLKTDPYHPQVLIVAHGALANHAKLSRTLNKIGLSSTVIFPGSGDAFPERLNDFVGVVSMGGTMSANDEDRAEIANELRFMERSLSSDVPLLGICLGAQLAARVLGGRVRRHRLGRVEIGFYTVTASPAGLSTLPQHSYCYQWHSEEIEIPPGGTLLASSRHFEIQAFEHSNGVLGVQFHPEIDSDTLENWLTVGAHCLTQKGAQNPARQRLLCRRHASVTDASLVALLKRAFPA